MGNNFRDIAEMKWDLSSILILGLVWGCLGFFFETRGRNLHHNGYS